MLPALAMRARNGQRYRRRKERKSDLVQRIGVCCSATSVHKRKEQAEMTSGWVLRELGESTKNETLHHETVTDTGIPQGKLQLTFFLPPLPAASYRKQ